jgi:Rps23 Pro-64 3,4-dihydroxylase Tpa1-like proline 4-hydroxylase
MRLLPLPAHVPVLIWDDFYTQEELALLWKEFNFLTDSNKLKPPKETGTAQEGEEYLKTATGVWIDRVYADRDFSDILKCNRKVFSKEITDTAKNINPLYCILNGINSDYTLLNYYESGGEYKKHRDVSVFTAVTIFMKDPASFSGGDFVLHEYDLVIEKRNNMLILFPGNLEHSVTPVQMNTPYTPFGGDGRYTITQFMNIKP